jgi:hypothetical protein
MRKPQARWLVEQFCPWHCLQIYQNQGRMILDTDESVGVGFMPVFSSKRVARKAFPKAQLIALVKAKEKP